MIEVPRPRSSPQKIAEIAEFFSFGTNDLTQLTFGYSRDDVAKFLPRVPRHGDPAAIRSRSWTRRASAS
jgi:pyruvate,orthophosphate dikinase